MSPAGVHHTCFIMQLYFVALLPDEPIQHEVTAFKLEARAHFDSGHALKSPPHITLVPPFQCPPNRQAELLPALHEAAAGLAPFPVQLRHFDRFGQRVIFVHTEIDQPLLTCQRVAADVFYQRVGVQPDTRPFHPHMTVAFKDLKRALFSEAWRYFSGQAYERQFMAEALTLLRHTGQRWETVAVAPLSIEKSA